MRRYAYYSKRVLEEKHPAKRWWLIRESTTIGSVVPTSACPSPDVYSKYLNDKLSDIRRSTNGALPPDFTDRQQGSELSCFSQTSHEEVSRLINSLPNKYSKMDPIPTWLLKELSGEVPVLFKVAQVSPVIKKPTLDPNQPSSFRPISNLSVISKLLE